MEFVTRTSDSHSSLSPPHSETSFPIIAIAIIGILATAFLLVTYYTFVIKCCLNWHTIDLLRRFSPPARRRRELPAVDSPGAETRGLDESVIRSIPLLHYKKTIAGKFEEYCAICLSEFQDHEMLRIFPICSHLFHIDCVDVWLQNNANCPLCRTAISGSTRFAAHQIAAPSTSRQDFIVIDFGNGNGRSNQEERPERQSSFDSLAGKVEQRQRMVGKKGRKLQKVTSFGDEWIDARVKDESFCVQPIRRSVSMDSSAERQMYLAVQEALQRNGSGDGGSGRGRRSLFSFGQSRSCRNAVQPLLVGES